MLKLLVVFSKHSNKAILEWYHVLVLPNDFAKLTLKAPVTTAADDIHKFHCFSEKIKVDVASESSARQRIHMENQALFSSKDKSKNLKCRLLPFLFGALRVNDALNNGPV